MKLDVVFFAGETRLSFDAKPSADIRAALKRKGFQWYPAGQLWRRRVRSGDADFAAWLRRALAGNLTDAVRRPVGPCWECGAPDGHFRNEGAASPVRCDACAARIAEERKADGQADRRFVPDRFDMEFEDRCAAVCGL